MCTHVSILSMLVLRKLNSVYSSQYSRCSHIFIRSRQSWTDPNSRWTFVQVNSTSQRLSDRCESVCSLDTPPTDKSL